MQNMGTCYTHSPADIRYYSTEQLRDEFLVEKVFIPDAISLTYTYSDRIIFGGVTPTAEELEIILGKELGAGYFLERRELGAINIGGPDLIEIDGAEETMKKQDGYYIGKETKHARFSLENPDNPAKFYISYVPTHHKYPNIKISIDEITPMETGDLLTLSQRRIYQYVCPSVYESCQLQVGYTILGPGSAWNTMPCHTHEHHIEAYVYFDMEEDMRVFHMMSKPDETKRLVMSNEQAAISPSWSIHSGVDTGNYSFIWAMCGENITYIDMDMVAADQLK